MDGREELDILGIVSFCRVENEKLCLGCGELHLVLGTVV